MQESEQTSESGSEPQQDYKANSQYEFFRRNRLQNLAGQTGASWVLVGLGWNMANQSVLLVYLFFSQLLVLLTAYIFYSRWTNQNRSVEGLPKYAVGLAVIRKTFLGSVLWFDLVAAQSITFALAVTVVLFASLLGSVVTMGPFKSLIRSSIICLLLPSALACLVVGHYVLGFATLFFIYVVALRGVRQVGLAYDELMNLREESLTFAYTLQNNNRKLLKSNEQLEREIEHRTIIEKDREKLQLELVEASRQAGKAEIATGVLHNVGNVMNSVNVGTSMLKDDLRKHLLKRLDASVDLLTKHEDDLPGFFADNPKAKHFIPFLRVLRDRTEEMQGDFDTLLSHIEHVNTVVASQQSFALTGVFTVKENPIAIVESAIQITSERFTELNVNIETHFEPIQDALLDRSKLIQILVNILKNAALSVSDSGKEERLVTVRVSTCEKGMEISISDTGVGISKENLKKIFRHGFTTRSDRGGHGFGLHHSANAIAELGGELSVDSDGEMQGATFSIVLPLQRVEDDKERLIVSK